MKTGVTSTKHLASMSFRIDPSLHLSEGLKVREKLSKSPYGLLTINDVSEKVFLGNIFSRVFVKDKEHGKTYLAASDTVLANIETGRFLSYAQANKLKHLWLKKDWILVTCSGTLGNVTYTNSTFEDKIATHDLIRIVPNDNHILKGVVYAFLAGRYGYYQITQSQFGGVVKHTNDKAVGAITIPKFPKNFQKQVDDLIQKSARLREEATYLLEEAQLIIESRFEGQRIKKSGSINIANISSDAMSRIDASYHFSDSTAFEGIIGKGAFKKLRDLCSDIFGGGRAKRYYTENKEKGVPFLSNTDLGRANPLRTCKYSLRNKGFDEGSVLKHGMIVTGRVGAIGQTQYIGKSYEEMQIMGSDNVIRIVPSQNSGYLFAYLSSKIGNSMFWKYATGGVQPFISSSMVGNILVPIYDNAIIEKCNQLVELYSEKRELSNILENTAISMIEQEIETWN